MTNVCVLLLVSLAVSVSWAQGYRAAIGDFGRIIQDPGSIGGWDGGPPVYSKRENANSLDQVGDLVEKIENLVTAYKNGTTTITSVKQALNEIATEAKAIIVKAEVRVTDQDVISFAGDVVGSFLHLLAKHPLDESPTLEFAIDLLNDIVEKAKDEPEKTLIAVTAIEQTASSISKILSGIQRLLERLGLPLGKRQTTVSGHYDHGPGGTSYGGSVSHTWGKRLLKRQTNVGVDFTKDPSGTSYSIYGSHKFDKGKGSVGGSYEHTPYGNNYGVSGSYKWKRPNGGSTSVGGYVGTGVGGPTGGIRLTHVFGRKKNRRENKRQTTVGADYNHGPDGTSYGVHGSHTFNHAGGSKTTLGGSFGHNPAGNSYGLSVSHSWGKRMLKRNV